MTARHTYVIAFDVSHDHRRDRLARFLEAHGQRVQRSVFEVVASTEDVRAILAGAQDPTRFDPKGDSLRCYRLCGECVGVSVAFGDGPSLVAAGRPLVL